MRHDNSLLLIQDYALADLQQHHSPDHALSRRWCQQLALAVQYLHSHQIIHCDIKAANVLLYSDNNIKLTDFSISIKKWSKSEIFTRGACTSTHRAPECIEGKAWSEKIDIWSLGCTFYEFMFGASLFAGSTSKKELLDNIHSWYQDQHPVDPIYLTSEFAPFRDLLGKILVNVEERYSITQVLQHPWITEGLEELSSSIANLPGPSPVSELPTEILETLSYLVNKYHLPLEPELYSLTYDLYCRSSLVGQKKRLLGSYWIAMKLHRQHKSLKIDKEIEKVLSGLEHGVASSVGYRLGA